MERHVEKYEKIDTEFFLKVLHHFCIDDFNCAVKSYEQGVDFYKKIKKSFHGRKFLYSDMENK